jgi:hypothetical protein
MTPFIPGAPQPDEYKPHFAGYVAKAAGVADPVQALTEQLGELCRLLEPLDTAAQLHRYAPGKWSVKEVAGHITDTERVMSYRLLRVARADQTPLPGFDENLFVTNARFDECAWADLLEEFRHVRHASILLLRHLPEAAWTRRGVSPEHPTSVRALAYILFGHAAHHLDILRERYLPAGAR